MLAYHFFPPVLRSLKDRDLKQYIFKFYRYLNAYKNKGVDFWALSQGNEVVLGYLMGNSMPNLALFPPQLKTWTRDHLGPLLKNSTFRDLKVITLDDERDYLRWYSREVSLIKKRNHNIQFGHKLL